MDEGNGHKNGHYSQAGQSGDKIEVGISDLNAHEITVLHTLASAKYPASLDALAHDCFKGEQRGNSWVRNSLRKLVCGGLVEKTGPSSYRITMMGAKEATTPLPPTFDFNSHKEKTTLPEVSESPSRQLVTVKFNGEELYAYVYTAVQIPLTELVCYRKNPACRTSLDDKKNQKLLKEIQELKFIRQPADGVLRADGKIELGDGNRRKTFAEKAGLLTMPVTKWVPAEGTDENKLVQYLFNAAEDNRRSRPQAQNVAVLLAGDVVNNRASQKHRDHLEAIKEFLTKEEFKVFKDGDGQVDALNHAWKAAKNHFLSGPDIVNRTPPPPEKVAELFRWMVTTDSIRGVLEHNGRWSKGNHTSGRAFFKAFKSKKRLTPSGEVVAPKV
jgi:hypothetical protein